MDPASILGRMLDPLARATMGAPAVDFARPAGEPALAGADSVSWRVFRNPVVQALRRLGLPADRLRLRHR